MLCHLYCSCVHTSNTEVRVSSSQCFPSAIQTIAALQWICGSQDYDEMSSVRKLNEPKPSTHLYHTVVNQLEPCSLHLIYRCVRFRCPFGERPFGDKEF